MWNEEPRETELAFKVADRIISIQECEEGYDYSIMDENYHEIDGGVYDNPDVDIRYALLDIVDDLATHPDTNGAKGNISSDAKWVQLDFDEVSEQMDIANLPGPEVFMSRVVMEFKAKTEESFRKIGNMSATDIEERVAEYVNAKLYENDFNAEIIGVVISGSRCRGLEGKNSDLDVVLQLSGNEREDDLFNLLHEDKFRIGGVLVDINPITEYKTGTLEEYLYYNRHYYMLFDQRIPYIREMTKDERFFILTLFTIFMEAEDKVLDAENTVLNVDLPVGLLPKYYGALFEKFQNYFKGIGKQEFYKDREYTIKINDVVAFPQDYADAMTNFSQIQGYNKVVTVGIEGFTLD